MGEIHDWIVVGSGCTGAMAAQTLVEAGARTTMLDVGYTDRRYAGLIPDKDFVSIRKTEPDQHRYFLGDEFEGIPLANAKAGAQLTPPRRFIVAQVEKYLRFESSAFRALESLAYGGLGNGWGAGCCVYSRAEMGLVGLDASGMGEAYRTVSGRIGISGMKDDASPYTLGDLDNFLPALTVDANCRALRVEYLKRRARLNRDGFYMGQPALAVISRDMGDRHPVSYREMDFYSDRERAAYRPWITVDRLKAAGNFRYVDSALALRFIESDGLVTIECLNTLSDTPVAFRCRNLVLATGVLGTARIVLRSLGHEGRRLPLLSNPHAFFPCIQLRMLGKQVEAERHSFAQLSLFHDRDNDGASVAMASLYSYRALMLFRIIGQVPLNLVDSRIILNYLMPGMVIMGIHHPESASRSKNLRLEADPGSITGDRLSAEYALSDAEQDAIKFRERKFLKVMRNLGCYSLGRIDQGPGSSIHYAGTLPFDDRGAPFTLRSDGKLNGARNVFVADGSGFRHLPAKGLTFSLMANAHLVVRNLLNAKT